MLKRKAELLLQRVPGTPCTEEELDRIKCRILTELLPTFGLKRSGRSCLRIYSMFYYDEL